MERQRDYLFRELLEKTSKLGHQVTSEEMASDKKMPKPNDYAYYFGSFANAAREAWRQVNSDLKSGEEDKGVKVLKVTPKDVKEKENYVISEIVNMYIELGGSMPSTRDIKKNSLINEDDVARLRRRGLISEGKIRELAEERTGKKYLTPYKRAAKNREEQREREREVMKMKEEKQKETEQKVVQEVKQEAAQEVAHEATQKVEPKVAENAVPVERKGKMKFLKNPLYTYEYCKDILYKECKAAGHILSQTDIIGISTTTENFPSYPTLKNKLGPWWGWSKLFGLPFKSEAMARQARRAEKRANGGLLLAGSEGDAALKSEMQDAKDVVVAPKPKLAKANQKKDKRRSRYSFDYCKKQLLMASTSVGHVLTQDEILRTKVHLKDFPSVPTLEKYLGPWWGWSELLGLPFKTESLAKQAYMAKIMAKGGTIKVVEPEPESVPEAEVNTEPEVELELESETKAEPEAEMMKMREIPFKLLVPEGVSVTVTIQINI
jgi:hypothetical protein